MKAIFCYICLSFCNAKDGSFSIKVSDKKHLYTRLTEHEHSHCHNAAVEAYLKHLSKVGILLHMFGSPSAESKRHMVQHRRAILHRVIEIIKTLGKQGLAFRGKRNESSFTLLDDAVNHGNFLAVAKLIGKFDEIMHNQVRAIAEKGRQYKSSPAKTRQSRPRISQHIPEQINSHFFSAGYVKPYPRKNSQWCKSSWYLFY